MGVQVTGGELSPSARALAKVVGEKLLHDVANQDVADGNSPLPGTACDTTDGHANAAGRGCKGS